MGNLDDIHEHDHIDRSIRDGEARLSVMLMNVIKIAHLVLRT